MAHLTPPGIPGIVAQAAGKIVTNVKRVASDLARAPRGAGRYADASAQLGSRTDKATSDLLPDRARFIVPGSGDPREVIDRSPDLISHALTHHDEVVHQALQDGVRPATLSTAVYNRRTGMVSYGQNNSFYPNADPYAVDVEGVRLGPPHPLHEELARRMPKRSREKWLPGNCAEIHAMNRALRTVSQRGETPSMDDFAYATTQHGRHRGPCRNCEVLLGGATEITEPGPQHGLFIGGAVQRPEQE